jgi:predicted nucleic acid-binding Zn ribbon protein
MSSTVLATAEQQRRRVRRSALLWALIAAAFYVGFIVLALVRGAK